MNDECIRIRDEIKKYRDELEKMKTGDPRIPYIRGRLYELYTMLAEISGKIKLVKEKTPTGNVYYCVFCGYSKIPMKKVAEFFGESYIYEDYYMVAGAFSSLFYAGMHLFENHFDKICD